MTVTNSCPECGISVPSDAPQGLCPRCLLGAASSATSMHRPAEKPRDVGLAEFLESVREMDLVDDTQLDGHAGVAAGDAGRLARRLVQAGLLTDYQAGAILQGKAHGLLIGRYLVLGKLGVGGMGVVFKARHRPSGRVVDLKMLPPSFGRDPVAVRRFRREFEVASRLSHPNLVAAIEASEDRGVHFLTMDYIEGYDLEHLVARGGPMAVRLALHCAIQAARGLEAAHTQGVVHRDIKPGHYMGPIKPPSMRLAEEWNTLTLRVRRRRMEVLVNGTAVGDPIELDWDLLPSRPQIAVYKPDLGTRIRGEYDHVEVRALVADSP